MMAAGLQLTAEQEAAGWAVLDAMQAAGESGDPMAKVKAACALLDWQMDAGLLTREELRAMAAPHLREMASQLDESPEGRQFMTRIRDEAMELLNGDDYAERAGAALLLVTLDGVQRPRFYAAQAKRDKEQRRSQRHKLIRMQDRAEDVAPLLWMRAYVVEEGAEPDPEAARFREALLNVRALHESVGVMLERLGYRAEPATAFMRAPAEMAE